MSTQLVNTRTHDNAHWVMVWLEHTQCYSITRMDLLTSEKNNIIIPKEVFDDFAVKVLNV